MKNSNPGLHTAVAFLVSMCLIAGCGGTKVLKEPLSLHTDQALAVGSDQRITATLDWVIVRDGPGTWARNADWDEYLLRVKNLSDKPIEVVMVVVVDSLDTTIEPQSGRKELVKNSKRTARRYKDSGLKVKAGRGAATLLVSGAAVSMVGASAASMAAYGSILSGSSVGAGASAAVSGLLLLGPALAVGGIVRSANNSNVNKAIKLRQTVLPLQIPVGEELSLDIFFPLAPSPKRLELTYNDVTGAHSLFIDTRTSMDGLHLGEPME